MAIEAELKAARIAQKRAVDSVADEIGVHPNTIRYAENGRSNIAHSTLQAWAAALGFDVILVPKVALAAAEATDPTPALAGAGA